MKRSTNEVKVEVFYCHHDNEHDPIVHVVLGQHISHPEKPRRSQCLLEAVKCHSPVNIHKCEREATTEELASVHSLSLIDFINNVYKSFEENNKDGEIVLDMLPGIGGQGVLYKPKVLYLQTGYYCFDTSTPIGKHTARIARISAGIAIDAAKLFSKNIAENNHSSLIYALCRPPGHHTTKEKYGGYCYFNNVALAAEILSKSGKVVVLDVDYHHGNGTQDIFYSRNDVYFISLHADPEFAYPFFSGGANELGIDDGLHYNKNFPLPKGTYWTGYKKALDEAIKIITSYDPLCVIVSLGLDTADKDPICSFHLKPQDYHEMGSTIKSLGKPTMVVQEGGYSDNDILGPSCFNFLEGLTGAPPPQDRKE